MALGEERADRETYFPLLTLWKGREGNGNKRLAAPSPRISSRRFGDPPYSSRTRSLPSPFGRVSKDPRVASPPLRERPRSAAPPPSINIEGVGGVINHIHICIPNFSDVYVVYIYVIRSAQYCALFNKEKKGAGPPPPYFRKDRAPRNDNCCNQCAGPDSSVFDP